MRRLIPDPAEDVDVEAAYAIEPGTRWLRANMVSTVDGSVSDAQRLSAGISGPADKELFAMLRAMADAVLVGAGTVRAERYRPAALPIVIVSRRLDLDLSTALFTEASNRTVVITAADAPPDRLSATAELADVICAGEGVVDLSAGVAQLRERGLAHLVCEGGPTLLGALLAERSRRRAVHHADAAGRRRQRRSDRQRTVAARRDLAPAPAARDRRIPVRAAGSAHEAAAVPADRADAGEVRQGGAGPVVGRPVGCSTSRSGTASAASCSATATRSSCPAAANGR